MILWKERIKKLKRHKERRSKTIKVIKIYSILGSCWIYQDDAEDVESYC